jgi:RNA polymerase sigma-70 factor, ECF subfamily
VSLEQIIKECKRYNKLAQQILYEKYAPAMNGICLRYVNDREAVKDIVQEGFIKVFSSIKQYKGEGSFEGWMKRIFVNTAISHLRKAKGKKFLSIEDIHETELAEKDDHVFEEIEGLPKHISGLNDFQLVSSANFSESELLKVLENLPDKYRIVFNLFCIEDFKHEEIAGMIGIDIATSRTRLMRARIMVQKELYALSIVKLSIG